MNNKTHAIVFDVGNVLLTFQPREFMRELFQDPQKGDICYSLTIQSPEWRELDRGVLAVETAIEIFKRRNPSWAAEIDLFFQRWHDMFHPIPETIQLLGPLRERGYKLHILSNFIREMFHLLHPRLAFFNRFDGIVTSFSVGMVKPDRDIYEHLLAAYKLDAAECLFIDDMPSNVEGALAVGIPAIQFQSPAQLLEKFQERGIL